MTLILDTGIHVEILTFTIHFYLGLQGIIAVRTGILTSQERTIQFMRQPRHRTVTLELRPTVLASFVTVPMKMLAYSRILLR